MKRRDWFVKWRGHKFGIETNRVHIADDPYLDRYILHAGFCIRLHKFWRGDDMRAPHDHPFAFITVPLTSYVEVVPVDEEKSDMNMRVVHAFMPHFRRARFRHAVLGRKDLKKKPFWSLVLASPVTREWGFWPYPKFFVPWEKWV